jgi:hypothetical protein
MNPRKGFLNDGGTLTTTTQWRNDMRHYRIGGASKAPEMWYDKFKTEEELDSYLRRKYTK